MVVNVVGELDIVPGAVPTEELELEPRVGAVPTEELELEPPVGNGAIGAVPVEELEVEEEDCVVGKPRDPVPD